MDIYVINESLMSVGVVDTFESFIWSDRYSDIGDFEIYTLVNSQALTYLQKGYFLKIKQSDRHMVVDSIELSTDVEDGNVFIVKGRSLESILDRRIIWNQTTLNGSFQTAIQTLLDQNVINPSDSNRKIDNFTFVTSSDPIITALTIDEQYYGDGLLDVISYLCSSRGIGFKLLMDDLGNFTFELYAGVDRSYDQSTTPYVIFSPKYDNLISSNYYESSRSKKTITLVGGEGEGSNKKVYSVTRPGGGGSGLNRYESYTDASDISSATSGGTLTLQQYQALLNDRGEEALSLSTDQQIFSANVDPTKTFVYGVDFFLGDILQTENEFGISGKTRVTELIICENKSGLNIYPRFETVE